MTYQAVVFDLDGTLIDTMEDILRALNTALTFGGYPPLGYEACRERVGWGLTRLVESSLPLPDRDNRNLIAHLTEKLVAAYREDPVSGTFPYRGIPELLHRLTDTGLPLFVWTNKEQSIAETVIQSIFPTTAFRAVLGDTPSRPRKPDPAGGSLIEKLSGASGNRILYAGDSDVDMQTAQACGFFSVGVLWGYRSARQLSEAGARKLVETPEELFSLI